MESCEETNLKEEKYHLDFVIPLIAFYTTTTISTTLLNALVIITIYKTPSLQTPSRILLCSLALTDLLVGAVVQPLYVVACVLALLKWCEAFDIVYHLASRIGYGLSAMSMITLTAISVDRFLAIKTKHSYKLIVTKKRSFILMVFLWTVPGASVILIRYFKKDDKNDTKLVVIFMVVLLLAITTFYSMSLYYLKKLSASQVANTTNQPSSNQPASDFNIWKYKRSLVTMVMVLGLILMLYLPVVFLLSTRTLSEVLDDPGLLHLCESFVLLNSTLNPILYLWRMKELYQALKNLLFQT
jgi:hypothetical protein